MATLGSATSPGSAWAAAEIGSIWRLKDDLDAYSRPSGPGLATQIRRGRCLRVLDRHQSGTGLATARLRVRLLEDGYPCWLDPEALIRHGEPTSAPQPRSWSRYQIATRLEAVIAFARAAMARPNVYLWGGSLGPTSTAPDWCRRPSRLRASGYPATPTCRSASAARWRGGSGRPICCNREI